ncbi:MAG TPA: FkbM family methyltransferase [Solirubrobacteraceae bacterium]
MNRLRETHLRARKLARILTRKPYRDALRQGVAAGAEHERVPFSDGHRTVLDVGAASGQFSLFATGRWPSARVVCFEPLERPRSQLVAVLGDRVEVHATALGESAGTEVMNVATADDSSSLRPIGERQHELFGTERAEAVDVPVARLDDLVGEIERPCLLKIDVQGFELEVLRGAHATLAAVDEAYVECSFEELYAGQALASEIISELGRHGLSLAGVFNITPGPDRTQVQGDFLFRRRPTTAR